MAVRLSNYGSYDCPGIGGLGLAWKSDLFGPPFFLGFAGFFSETKGPTTLAVLGHPSQQHAGFTVKIRARARPDRGTLLAVFNIVDAPSSMAGQHHQHLQTANNHASRACTMLQCVRAAKIALG